MRSVKKFGAAAVVAAMMASGMTVFSSTVHAAGSSAPTRSAICDAIDKAEAQLAASTNPFVKKYLTALLNYLAGLEKHVGCTTT